MTRRPWNHVEIELLRRGFADNRTDDLARTLGRSCSTVSQKAAKLGLKKSEAYLASPAACRLRRGDNVGEAYRFKPGHASWNKGLKGVFGVQEACRATQFKKGRPAHEARNYLPIGSLRISKDGYLERKVTDDPGLMPARRWVAVHRLVWAEAHGPVPAGHVVCFKPGRTTADLDRITLDALELVSRRDLMLRNTVHRYGKDVARLVQLRGALTRQINERSKEEKT